MYCPFAMNSCRGSLPFAHKMDSSSISPTDTVESFYQFMALKEANSFYDYFCGLLRRFGDSKALTDPEKRISITYSEFLDSVEQMLHCLNTIGVRNLDIIGTCTGNSLDYLLFVVAAISLGAVVLPLNPACKPNEIQKYFSQVDIRWILTEQQYIYKFDHLKWSSNTVNLITIDTSESGTEYISLPAHFNRSEKDNVADLQVLNNGGAFIFYSSGTSGPPKGVLIGIQQLIANIEIVNVSATIKTDGYAMPKINTESVVYGVLPYFHAGGLLTTLCLMTLGAHIIVNKKFNPNLFYDTIYNYKVSVLNVVPTVLQMIANCSSDIACKLYNLKYIFVGSSKTDAKLIDCIRQRFQKITIIELYGSTETGAINFMHPAQGPIRPGSCGVLLPGNKAKVLNLKTGQCCKPLEVGELWLQTPTLMSGYINNVGLKTRDSTDEWYQTGDLACYDEDKFFYIKGRIKEMIKVRGWQVSPAELEEEILKLSDVKECAVVGVEDKVSGQVPKAYVVVSEGSLLTQNDINAIIQSKFSSYKQLVKGIEFVAELPKTDSGKIAKHLLVETTEKSTE